MNIYLNVEISSRELDSKLLLATVAAARGHRVVVSDLESILKGVSQKVLAPGIFHTKSLNQELNKRGCSGKKIDFILQELFREANTLSVKLDDPKIKNLALDTKLLIEEMREQIQNVE